MRTESPEIEEKHNLAIVALLEKPTIKAAAAHVGMGETTLHRWLKDETFASAYRQAQRSLYDHAMGHLQSATGEAAKTLREIMLNENAAESARVTAARTVLDFARQHINLQDLVERIDALESNQAPKKEQRP